jgi:hypothetical protein
VSMRVYMHTEVLLRDEGLAQVTATYYLADCVSGFMLMCACLCVKYVCVCVFMYVCMHIYI